MFRYRCLDAAFVVVDKVVVVDEVVMVGAFHFDTQTLVFDYCIWDNVVEEGGANPDADGIIGYVVTFYHGVWTELEMDAVTPIKSYIISQ